MTTSGGTAKPLPRRRVLAPFSVVQPMTMYVAAWEEIQRTLLQSEEHTLDVPPEDEHRDRRHRHDH